MKTIVSSLILLIAASNLQAATHFVSVGSTNATPPYVTWATAATNIQDAVNVAATNDVVVVTNGVYPGGVSVRSPVTVLSVNGPASTAIDGGGTNPCIWLSAGSSLTGFTVAHGVRGVSCDYSNVFLTNCVLTGNRAAYGGGVCYGTLYNCVLNGNQAAGWWVPPNPPGWPLPVFNPGQGGGALQSMLVNCTISGNSAIRADGAGVYGCDLYNCTLTSNQTFAVMYSFGGSGGGACYCTLHNCTLAGNFAEHEGGGASSSAIFNSILTLNNASAGTNYDTGCRLKYCCTTPLPPDSVGNIDADPLFVDTNGWRNLRLESNSPCINAGNNDFVATTSDFDGNPRILSGTVDIGAYEYPGAGSRISYAWLQQYGLPIDGPEDFIDSDHDGLNNWQEWIAGTCPTNAQSALRLVSAVPSSTNVTVTWQSVAGVTYFVQCGTNLAAPFAQVASFILGQAGTTSYADTNRFGTGPFFYRVGVLPPGAN